MLREYGRSSATFNQKIDLKSRFQEKLSGVQYDLKYFFSEMGYNFIPSEISAAFGLSNLKKLKFIVNKRIKVFKILDNFLKIINFLKHLSRRRI